MKHRFSEYNNIYWNDQYNGINFFEIGDDGTCEVYDYDLEHLRDWLGFEDGTATDERGIERKYVTLPPEVMEKIKKAFKIIGEPYRIIQ